MGINWLKKRFIMTRLLRNIYASFAGIVISFGAKTPIPKYSDNVKVTDYAAEWDWQYLTGPTVPGSHITYFKNGTVLASTPNRHDKIGNSWGVSIGENCSIGVYWTEDENSALDGSYDADEKPFVKYELSKDIDKSKLVSLTIYYDGTARIQYEEELASNIVPFGKFSIGLTLSSYYTDIVRKIEV